LANAKLKRFQMVTASPQKRWHDGPCALGKPAAGGDRYRDKRKHDRTVGLAERGMSE